MSASYVSPIQKFIANLPEYMQIQFSDWIASLGKTVDDIISWKAYQETTHPGFFNCHLTVIFADGSKHERLFKRDILKELR